MPKISKNAFSRFIGTGCERQLRLYLATAQDRGDQDMPSLQPARPGLQEIAREGDRWQFDKTRELGETFGEESLVAESREDDGEFMFIEIPFATALDRAKTRLDAGAEDCWIVESQFEVGTAFKDALDIHSLEVEHAGLTYSELRMDLVEAAPSGTFDVEVTPSGDLTAISDDDGRKQLRVIDVKLTSQPSAAYFAEVVLYSMALSGWLRDHGVADDWVVVSSAALWPGSHETSNLKMEVREAEEAGLTLTPEQLRAVLAKDLEVVPFEVFAPTVRNFFQRDVPRVLSSEWRDLEWHVDSKCKSCNFVGAPWQDRHGNPTADAQGRHCIQMAETEEHLSRVADVTRGASKSLQRGGVETVSQLAERTHDDEVFDGHHALRGTRTVVSKRAETLTERNGAVLIEHSGTSAVMPKWTDLRIEISVDFDVSSAISFAFGVQGFFYSRDPYEATPWQPRAWIVDVKSLDAEFDAFAAFLRAIHQMLAHARAANPDATVQFYVWDQLELKHFSRIVGRHLIRILEDDALRDLAWLFPSEDLLPNPEYLTRRSPTTVVRDVVRAHVATEVPHYYSMIETARQYHNADLDEQFARFPIHPLFMDPLSDQVPSERAHEIWSKSTNPPWGQQAGILDETVKRRLRALGAIRRRLEEDLSEQLQYTAPKASIGAISPIGAVAIDSTLWYAFSKVDAAVEALEADQSRSLPPHEREAKFLSAKLTRRLDIAAEIAFLQEHEISRTGFTRVFELPESSRELKARSGDISFALCPESMPGLLDRRLAAVVTNTDLENLDIPFRETMADVLKVKVLTLDRDACRIAIELNDWFAMTRVNEPRLFERLEDEAGINLSENLMLDPIAKDFFSKKLLATLRDIGSPPRAQANPLVRRALGDVRPRGPRNSDDSPITDFIWDADHTFTETAEFDLDGMRPRLEAAGHTLNDSQWSALHGSLTKRIQTIWGPPGTGKSRTLKTILLGALANAEATGTPIRILVCAPTYRALDNVLEPTLRGIGGLLENEVGVHRLRSGLGPPEAWAAAVDHEVDRYNASEQSLELCKLLNDQAGPVVVGATPQQVWALMQCVGQAAAPWFDLVVFDEASQINVANAVLALASVAPDAQVIVAGDPMQLSPIRRAEPPVGLEAMVGSIYDYFDKLTSVERVSLDDNYRSNAEIVEFQRQGGYPDSLSSVSENLRIAIDPPQDTVPEGWPESAPWSEGVEQMCAAEPTVMAFRYDDVNWSSQWNHFEAHTVVGIVASMRRRLKAGLIGEIGPDGNEVPLDDRPIEEEAFWAKAIGIVSPHRAQQALVVSLLQNAFPEVSPDLIRGAVDTVERFQGQQRNVIVVSYALGDPDAIRDEEEFLLGFERFNVAASRARTKLIVLVSEQVVEHLSDDLDVVRASRLLKLFVEGFCNEHAPLSIDYFDDGGNLTTMSGQLRWHE